MLINDKKPQLYNRCVLFKNRIGLHSTSTYYSFEILIVPP